MGSSACDLETMVCHAVGPLQTDCAIVHLFTDGSCFRQHDSFQRFASWSVVCAGYEGDFSDSFVHAAGHLPGLIQSAYRAEVFATRQALKAMARVDGAIAIWTDCVAVVRRLSALLSGSTPSFAWAHGDLWMDIADLLDDIGHARIRVTKVAAHRATTEVDPLEEWRFWHNTFAESLYQAHAQACSAAEAITAVVHNVQLAISKAVLEMEHVSPDVVEPEPCEVLPPASTA